VDRILGIKRKNGKSGIEKVLVGVVEPDTFVGVNDGRKRLEEAGIKTKNVDGWIGRGHRRCPRLKNRSGRQSIMFSTNKASPPNAGRDEESKNLSETLRKRVLKSGLDSDNG
jgi:hypothetical protein